MNAEIFAEWQRRQGNEVIRTKSSYWYEASPHVFQAFPYHWVISPSDKEIKDLIRANAILALRYSTPIESTFGKISYHVVQNTPPILESLKGNSRKHILTGLKNCEIKPITMNCQAKEGWKLQKATLNRQNRTNCMSQKKWETLCLSSEDLPGFQSWGAYVNDELASSIFTVIINDTGLLLYAFSLKKYFSMYINNALFYFFAHNLFLNEGIKSLFMTLQSLDAPKSVDEFKFRMGFQPNPVRQRVVFHPLLKPFINSFSHKLINYSLQLFPDNPILPKAEGMIRFYREGKMPVTKQDVPDCVDLFTDNIFKNPITT